MRMGSRFLPQGAMTGIGSLPQKDPQAAIAFVAQLCPEVPFWAQLPQRSVNEQMIEQALGVTRAFFERRSVGYSYQVKSGLLSACIEYFSAGTAVLQEQDACGFFAFERACASRTFMQAQALKGQLIGPITLACSLFQGEQSFLFDERCLEALTRYIVRLALWQMRRLQQWHLPVICFLDEPCLALLTREPFQQVAGVAIQALRTVITALQATGVLVGLHCCAEQTSFHLMCQTEPDILSFDAYQNLELFGSDQDAHTFLKGGGIVAYGLIPTLSDQTTIDATTFFTRWLLSHQDLGDISQIAAQTMVTATCGLGLLPLVQAQSSFDMTRHVAELVKKVAQISL